MDVTVNGSWRNWAGNVTASPTQWYRPVSVDQICAAVKSASADGQKVRVLGSGHSFTPAAASNGAVVDLAGWSGVLSADTLTGLVTVRSGTTIRQLNVALDALGLAMENLGDIDAQTISGAISTGTHGTGAGLGGLATQVAALELVRADGSVVTCSAKENPELFQAARVSVGALGVISAVTLRCVPAFRLVADERPMPLDEVVDRFEEFAAGNDHFEFYWFPYGRKALVKRNNRLERLSMTHRQPSTAGERAGVAGERAGVAGGGSSTPLTDPGEMPKWRRMWEFEVMENAAFGALCRAGRAAPRLIPSLNRFSSSVLSPRSYSASSHEVFVTSRRVRFVESEYAIPRGSVLDVLGELRREVPKLDDPVMFPVEVRVAASDDLWLSTAHGRDSAYLAIHQYAGLPYQKYFELFESIVAAVAGRPHWGKMHTLDASRLRELYPRFDDFLRVRDEMDPSRVFSNAYTRQVFGD
jgi:FAD/FMN-containing dehydrogenase